MVGAPIKTSDKYNKVEKMVKVYVGIHDRINDELRQDRVYGVENIRIVCHNNEYSSKLLMLIYSI